MVCLTLCLATIGSLSNQDDGSNENVKKHIYVYICLVFKQGACTESLDGQVQGAIAHPPHP